jgi:beta-lactamase regulating signal transducer with metallopeptidase domain
MMDRFASLALESSVRASILIGVAGIAAWLLRRRSAELRHLVWLSALLATLAIPTLALAPRWSVPVLPSPAGSRSSASLVLTTATRRDGSPATSVTARSPRSPLGPLPFVWLIGCAALLAREIASRRQLERLFAGSRFPVALHGSLRSVMNELGIAAPVRCRVSPQVSVPLVFGALRSTILLPEAAGGWDRTCLRRVLLHELAHVRRRDPLWIMLAHVVRVLFWFHPLVWVAVACMRQESEHACDDSVVRGGERASYYAETLLFVAECAVKLQSSMASPFVTRSGLESRILGLFSSQRDVRALGAAQRILFAGAAAMVALVLAVMQPVAARASSGHAAPAAPTPAAAGGGSHGWLARAKKSPQVPAAFRDDAGAPVRILEAVVRIVPRAEGGETGLTGVELAIENDDRGRRVTGLRVALDLPSTRDRVERTIDIAPAGRVRLVLEPDHWSAVVPEGEASHLLVHITAVRFDRGDAWVMPEPALAAPEARAGASEQPAPSPPVARAESKSGKAPTPWPPHEGAARPFPSGPALPARFRNPVDAPVWITAARAPEHDATAGPGQTLLPEVRLENRSGHRVVAVKLRFKASPESHAVTVFSTPIEPGATAVLWRDFTMQGRAGAMTVQVVGAQFENGEVWGSMDSLIDARDAWVLPLTDDPR